jgi:hypothetical protein
MEELCKAPCGGQSAVAEESMTAPTSTTNLWLLHKNTYKPQVLE